MENSPFGPGSGESDDSKESKASSKKTKSAEAIGAFAIEPKNEKAKDEKPPTIMERLTGAKEKEPTEAEAPLDSLSDQERQHVEAELVAADVESAPTEPSDDPESVAAEAAVASFREKIVEEGEDSETAFSETLAEITAEADEDDIESPQVESEPEEFEEAFIDLRNQEATPEPIVLSTTSAQPTPRSESRDNPVPEPEKASSGGYLVAGSAVAYLAGRRQGRIKTEKRMASVQRKLERQVKDLQTELKRKETVIRKVAVEQVRANSSEKPEAKRAERISKVVGAEAITLVTRETPREQQREHPEAKRNSPLTGLTEKDIITLNRQELLAISEKIIVEGTSLRQIYETRLVGEKGLRRLITEFLRGGNMNKALKRELIEKEIDFERDPILRDKNRDGSGTDGGGTYLEKLLEKVDNLPGGDSGEMAVLKARAAYEAAEQRKRERTRKTADMSLAAIIAILLTAIIVLLIGR